MTESSPHDGAVAGLLLAAGAGRRMGTPKALVCDADGTSWLRRSIGVLRDGGCAAVSVVIGADREAVTGLLEDQPVDVVVAADWAEGMGASLRSGLTRLLDGSADAAVVTLVDLPDVGAEVVSRVVAAGSGTAVLARAAYRGVPGHPVVLGRDHWAGVIASAVGDRGARDYLAEHEVHLIECGDLAEGRDVDTCESPVVKPTDET